MSDNTQPCNARQSFEQRDYNATNKSANSIKLFDELGPPGDHEPKNWSWHLRLVEWRRRTMKKRDYSKIDWKNEIDLQKFQQCVEPDCCFLAKYRGKPQVPIACNKHRQGTDLMWRRIHAETQEHWDAKVTAEEGAREQARAKADELTERVRAKNIDLWELERLWMPLGSGVAIITGTMLAGVATFFCDCDITIREHNQPVRPRRYTKQGRDIAAQVAAGSWEIKWSTYSWAQVRVSIDKFRQPGHAVGLGRPGDAALTQLKGQYGKAMCAVTLFLGSTGPPASKKVDRECSYWFYCASGFPGPNLSMEGLKAPFRMVRLSNESRRDPHDLMRRFDLKTGTKRAEAFCKGLDANVKEYRVEPRAWKAFLGWKYSRKRDPDCGKDDDPGEDDSSEDDRSQQADAQEGNAEDEDMQGSDSELSEFSEHGYMFPEDGDDSDDGFQAPMPGRKNGIPRHLRGGAKA